LLSWKEQLSIFHFECRREKLLLPDPVTTERDCHPGLVRCDFCEETTFADFLHHLQPVGEEERGREQSKSVFIIHFDSI
jgi:hypothetical protein